MSTNILLKNEMSIDCFVIGGKKCGISTFELFI